MGHSKSNRDFNQQLPYKLIRSKVWESSKNLASRSLRYSYDMSNLCFLHIEVYVICLCHDHMTTLWDNEGSITSLISLSVMQKERSVEGISFLHLFQISRDNWPTEKVSGRLFSCQVQSLFLSSKRKCTVIQGGFSIVKFIKKVCETI